MNRLLGNTDSLLNKYIVKIKKKFWFICDRKQKEILETTDFFNNNKANAIPTTNPIKISESVDFSNNANALQKKPAFMTNEDDFWYANGANNYGIMPLKLLFISF